MHVAQANGIASALQKKWHNVLLACIDVTGGISHGPCLHGSMQPSREAKGNTFSPGGHAMACMCIRPHPWWAYPTEQGAYPTGHRGWAAYSRSERHTSSLGAHPMGQEVYRTGQWASEHTSATEGIQLSIVFCWDFHVTQLLRYSFFKKVISP